MMYMVKYGATTSGINVPPAVESKLLARDNISRLMDNMITHLEEMTRTTGDNTGAKLYGSLDLRDVESFLEVNEGERVPGDLYQLIRQEQHCPWVCRNIYVRCLYKT
jgi:hypothetical protein